MRQLAAAQPDVIILASHIPDGVAFRQAMLAAGLQVGALIGSTMAECDPDFAGELGPAAVGVFASDRPTGGFQPTALESGGPGDLRPASPPPGRAGQDAPPAIPSAPPAAVDAYGRRWPTSRSVRRARPAATRSPVPTPRRRARRARPRRASPASLRRGRSSTTCCRPRRRDGQRRRGGRGGTRDRPAGGRAPERRRPPLLGRSGDARPERAGGGRHLAVAGGPLVHVRLASDLRDRDDRLRPARPMTSGRPPRRRRSRAPARRQRRVPPGDWITCCSPLVVAARWAATVGALADGIIVGAVFGVALSAASRSRAGVQRRPRGRQLVAGAGLGLAGGMALVALALATRWPGPWLPFDPAGILRARGRPSPSSSRPPRSWSCAARSSTRSTSRGHGRRAPRHLEPLSPCSTSRSTAGTWSRSTSGWGSSSAASACSRGGTVAPAVAHVVADLATWWI